MHDRTRGSTMQWQLNLAHYLHRYLHSHIEKSAAESAEKAEAASCWKDQTMFVQSATQLISTIQGILPTDSRSAFYAEPPIVMDEAFLNVTSPCCHACNVAASHTVKIKKALGIYNVNRKRLPGVPDASKLPLGMRAMHDAYLFIYLVGTFLAVLLARLNSPEITPTECFRHDGLIRLYVGYLIFTLAAKFSGAASNPFGDLSFEHWYLAEMICCIRFEGSHTLLCP